MHGFHDSLAVASVHKFAVHKRVHQVREIKKGIIVATQTVGSQRTPTTKGVPCAHYNQNAISSLTLYTLQSV